MSELLHVSLVELASMIRARSVSPVEVATTTLERVNEQASRLGAFIHITDDLLLAQARSAEAALNSGRYRGILHGIPLTVKDIFDVRGEITTAGSSFFRKRAVDDSAAWARLQEAGALLLGKTNLHEFCYGATSVNPHYGIVRNPWNPEHIAGGSSGGSAAAVAAGMGYGSLGSDTGGSVRVPAAFTGVVGFKPTRNRIATEGMFPLSTTFDHPGLLAKRALDAEAMWRAFAGGAGQHGDATQDWFDRGKGRILSGEHDFFSRLRVGVLSEHLADATTEVRRCVQSAIEHITRLGAEIIEVSIPEEEEAVAAARVIVAAEAAYVHRQWLGDPACSYGNDVQTALARGTELRAVDYVAARETWKRLAPLILRRQQSAELVIGPTVPITAPKVAGASDPQITPQLLRSTYVFNVTGQPALSVPCGLSEERLPVGLQIVAQPGDDSLTLRAAIAYELTGGPGLLPRREGAD